MHSHEVKGPWAKWGLGLLKSLFHKNDYVKELLFHVYNRVYNPSWTSTTLLRNDNR